MGKKDTISKEYLKQNVIFADAFNYYCYDGEKVIKPEDLMELDPTELAVIRKEMNRLITSKKMRDILKRCTIKRSKYATFVLLGIEAQSNIHYAMPVRDYLYDALNYAAQVEDIRKMHEEKNDLTEAEKLSGFSKNDKLIPVITLCICFDKKKWDAPRSLYDMFGEMDPRLAEYINDYKLNLITPDEIEDFSKFASELGAVMESIKVSDDKEMVHDIIKTRKNGIISDSTADMIRTFAGTNLVKKKAGGNIMISTGMQELMDDIRTEGKAEGLTEGETKGITKGEDLFASLIKAIGPDGKDFNKALNATPAQRKRLYKKYGITTPGTTTQN